MRRDRANESTRAGAERGASEAEPVAGARGVSRRIYYVKARRGGLSNVSATAYTSSVHLLALARGSVVRLGKFSRCSRIAGCVSNARSSWPSPAVDQSWLNTSRRPSTSWMRVCAPRGVVLLAASLFPKTPLCWRCNINCEYLYSKYVYIYKHPIDIRTHIFCRVNAFRSLFSPLFLPFLFSLHFSGAKYIAYSSAADHNMLNSYAFFMCSVFCLLLLYYYRQILN